MDLCRLLLPAKLRCRTRNCLKMPAANRGGEGSAPVPQLRERPLILPISPVEAAAPVC
jgi:hypothetical protein